MSAEPSVEPSTRPHRMRGTNGDDVLAGTPGDDAIDGLRGSDLIRGGPGNDELQDYMGVGLGGRIDTSPDSFFGGSGDDVIWSGHRDRVHAGSGNDTIQAIYTRRGDRIECGPGDDVVVLNDDDPGLVLRGCETVRVEYAG